MQLYSTADAEWRDKAQYWADIYRQLSFPIDLRPLDRASFAANLALSYLGPLGIGEFRTEPSRVFRTEQEIRETKERSFFLVFVLSGHSQISHCGHQIVLSPSDFVLTDSHSPSEVVVASSPSQQLSLRMSRELLSAYLPFPERLCGLRIDGTKGVARLVAGLLPGIWAQVCEGVRPEVHDLLVDSVLSTLAASYADEAGGGGDSPNGRRRGEQIRRFIERNLHDADLGPATVAAAHGVSTRYVHRLFEQEGEKLSQYVLRRRLDECAARLRNPLWQSMTITEVAFSNGFSNLSHFCRSFKKRFGQSPSRYREGG